MARAYRGPAVELAVYDLSPANDCLATIGFGLYHTGVRIGGAEYTFSNDGVFSHAPGECQYELRSLIPLGELTISNKEVEGVVSELRGAAFPAGSYHLVMRNCNHFSTALTERLGFSVPGWVNRLAWWGSWWPWWPKGMGGEGEGEGEGSAAAAPAPTYQAFGGGGQSLGGPAVPQAAGGGLSQREQMLAATQARMARLEAEQASEVEQAPLLGGGDKKSD